jgi:hypothetical protein
MGVQNDREIPVGHGAGAAFLQNFLQNLSFTDQPFGATVRRRRGRLRHAKPPGPGDGLQPVALRDPDQLRTHHHTRTIQVDDALRLLGVKVVRPRSVTVVTLKVDVTDIIYPQTAIASPRLRVGVIAALGAVPGRASVTPSDGPEPQTGPGDQKLLRRDRQQGQLVSQLGFNPIGQGRQRIGEVRAA